MKQPVLQKFHAADDSTAFKHSFRTGRNELVTNELISSKPTYLSASSRRSTASAN